MATIIRKVQNNLALPFKLTHTQIDLLPAVTVDLYDLVTDDELLQLQEELTGLAARGSILIIQSAPDSELHASSGGGGGGVSFPFLIPDGSASDPSIAFSSEPGTGIYKDGTGLMSFVIKGDSTNTLMRLRDDTQCLELRQGTGLRLYSGGDSYSAIIFVPALSNNVILTLPSVNGAPGDSLHDDGSGNLYFAASGGSSSGSTNDVQISDGSGGFTGSDNFTYNGSRVIIKQNINASPASTASYALAIEDDSGLELITIGADATNGYIQSWQNSPLVINPEGNDVNILPNGFGTLNVGTPLNMSSHSINNVTDPTNPQDAATKQYVDDNVGAASFPLLAPDGNAGVPSYSFSSNSGTGIYAIGGSELDISISGSQVASFTSSRIHLEGAIETAVSSITDADSPYSLADRFAILSDTSNAAITVTLPAAASVNGRVYVIKKTDGSANTVTIDPNASETIDGQPTYILTTQYEALMILCDGSNWFII
jgi:hypothetical protein